MNLRRVVLSSLVLVALARATCTVAEDNFDGAILGPAEPIGKLLIVKAGFDEEPAPLRPVPIPSFKLQVTTPPAYGIGPAHFPISVGGGGLSSSVRIPHGDEAAFHLSQAAVHLMSVGLEKESKQVSSFLKDFQTGHQIRLQLAEKLAQMKELQTEVDRLKLCMAKGIASNEVLLSVVIFEADENFNRLLAGPIPGETDGKHLPGTMGGVFEADDLHKLIDFARQKGSLKVLGEPRMVVMSSGTARLENGGKSPSSKVALAGGPDTNDYGINAEFSASIASPDRIQFEANIDVKELSEDDAVDGVPGVRRSKSQSTVELRDGQAVVFGWLNDSGKATARRAFIAVTPTIADPTGHVVPAPTPMPHPVQAIK